MAQTSSTSKFLAPPDTDIDGTSRLANVASISNVNNLSLGNCNFTVNVDKDADDISGQSTTYLTVPPPLTSSKETLAIGSPPSTSDPFKLTHFPNTPMERALGLLAVLNIKHGFHTIIFCGSQARVRSFSSLISDTC